MSTSISPTFSQPLSLPEIPSTQVINKTLTSIEEDIIFKRINPVAWDGHNYFGKLKVELVFTIPAGSTSARFSSIRFNIKLNDESYSQKAYYIPDSDDIVSLSLKDLNTGIIQNFTKHYTVYQVDLTTTSYTTLFSIDVSELDIKYKGGFYVNVDFNNQLYAKDPSGYYYYVAYENQNDEISNINFKFPISGKDEPTPSPTGTYKINFYGRDKSDLKVSGTYESSEDGVVLDTIYTQFKGSSSQVPNLPLSYTVSGSNTSRVLFYKTSSYNSLISSSPLNGTISTTTNYNQKKNSSNNCYWRINNMSASTTIDFSQRISGTVNIYAEYEVGSTTVSNVQLTLPNPLPSGVYNKGYTTDGNFYNKRGNIAQAGQQITLSNYNDFMRDPSRGNYDIRLYLEWTAVKYTIKFNMGSNSEWVSNNTIQQIEKTYGDKITPDELGYPDHDARLTKMGLIQYGWKTEGEAIGKNSNNTICTYTYARIDGDIGNYSYTLQDIDDTWYSEGNTVVNVYPCWEYIVHKVRAYYYIQSTDPSSFKKDDYEFNVDTGYMSIGGPKESPSSSNWSFLGWTQNSDPFGAYWPSGSDWRMHSGPSDDLRTYGVFRHLSDIGDSYPYSKTYGVNTSSLTSSDWNDRTKMLRIFGFYGIDSRLVYIDGKWKHVDNIWVNIDGDWKSAEDIYIYNEGWKQEVYN